MKKYNIHISIDDTINIFENLYKENYTSIFQNDTINFLRLLHNKFNAHFSLYCFYQNMDNSFNLSMLTNKYKKEFKKNSKWLKLGFHSVDGNCKKITIKDYINTTEHLERISSTKNLTKIIRLHNFYGDLYLINKIQKSKYPIKILLTSEKNISKNYYLSYKESYLLNNLNYYFDSNTNINFIKSDFRLDNIDIIDNYEVENALKKKNPLIVVYTHEWIFFDQNKIIKKKLYDLCNLFKEYKYKI